MEAPVHGSNESQKLGTFWNLNDKPDYKLDHNIVE